MPAIVTLVFLFTLAGVIGNSFLNVVVYRVPIGMSLILAVVALSQVPNTHSDAGQCANPWLAQKSFGPLPRVRRENCCDIRWRPARRHPVCDTWLAGAALEGGVNLPAPPPAEMPGQKVAFSIASGEQLWGQYAYHLTLVCGLFVLL